MKKLPTPKHFPIHGGAYRVHGDGDLKREIAPKVEAEETEQEKPEQPEPVPMRRRFRPENQS